MDQLIHSTIDSNQIFAGSALYHGSSAVAAVAHRPTPASGRAVVTCSYSFEGHFASSCRRQESSIGCWNQAGGD